MVWMNGLEPTTPCMSSKCSNQLSYTHIALVLYTIPTQIAIGNRKFPKKISVIRRQYVYACKLSNFFTPQLRRT